MPPRVQAPAPPPVERCTRPPRPLRRARFAALPSGPLRAFVVPGAAEERGRPSPGSPPPEGAVLSPKPHPARGGFGRLHGACEGGREEEEEGCWGRVWHPAGGGIAGRRPRSLTVSGQQSPGRHIPLRGARWETPQGRQAGSSPAEAPEEQGWELCQSHFQEPVQDCCPG